MFFHKDNLFIQENLDIISGKLTRYDKCKLNVDLFGYC